MERGEGGKEEEASTGVAQERWHGTLQAVQASRKHEAKSTKLTLAEHTEWYKREIGERRSREEEGRRRREVGGGRRRG